MLTVEERHDLIAKFEASQSVARNQGTGIDGVLRAAIARETCAREFYETLNACTDWGVSA